MGIRIPSNWHDVLVQQVKEKPNPKQHAPSIKQLELKLKRTIELYRNGDIDPVAYYKERDSLKARISAAQSGSTPPPPMQKVAVLIKNIPALWQVATPEERRDWVHTISSEIILSNESITVNIEPTLRPLFLATGVLTAMDVVGFEPTLDAF